LLSGCVVLHNQLNLTGHGNLGTLGATQKRGVKLVDFDIEVSGHRRKHVNVTAGGSHLEGLHAL
jgi:hypothetical protein